MKIHIIKEKPVVNSYRGIKNETKVLKWLCRKDEEELTSNQKSNINDLHDCHLSPEDGCDCQK